MQIKNTLMAAGASLAGLVNSANAAKYVNVSIEQGQKNFSAITYADKIVWALNLLNYAVHIVAIAVITYAGILMLMGGVGRVQDELRANAAFVTVIKVVVLLKFALVLIDLVFSW